MIKAKQKALLKGIETSNLKLPDIMRIKIDFVSDSNLNLSNFLSNCTSNQLEFLCINHFTTADTLIKSKINIDSLSKAVSAVKREVYIRMYEFSAADLQQFVRAACKAERIIIQRCSVRCSSALDFGSELKYNTNFLSFQCWGETSHKELKTDWMSDPSSFSHIVDAIGNSGLRHSLTKLCIAFNNTLDKTEVQEMLNEKGMAHISVVLESFGPRTE